MHRLPASVVESAPTNITAQTTNERAIPLITFTVFILSTSLLIEFIRAVWTADAHRKVNRGRVFALRILPKPAVEEASPHFSFWAEWTLWFDLITKAAISVQPRYMNKGHSSHFIYRNPGWLYLMGRRLVILKRGAPGPTVLYPSGILRQDRSCGTENLLKISVPMVCQLSQIDPFTLANPKRSCEKY